MNFNEIKADVVVIGGGGAALSAAINVGTDLDVLILDKGQVGKSGCSPNAHGGLAVHYKDPNDGPEIHFEDTLLSGGFLNNQDLVKILVENTGGIIQMLERYGALFDRDENGNLLVRRFGGHRYARSVFCGDETGHEMMNGLRREVYRLGIKYIDEAFVTRLLLNENGEIAGVFYHHLPTGEFYVVRAKSVVLATADAAGLWPAASERQRGDGIYMALMAGAEAADHDVVQEPLLPLVPPNRYLSYLPSVVAPLLQDVLQLGVLDDPDRQVLMGRPPPLVEEVLEYVREGAVSYVVYQAS